ncbi:hypothetical protein Q2T76_03670 [Lactobacillus sp. YT155]|uniref:hypothetical protein n=1 Tax=Lactobacillus sp. YT155 TaxID=3060955 RepID=UPI00265EA77C|nr:hypothetical protein [Lactobacillus sp. YT155]MDO1605152.1 hypothetical protein [Lactobacillus sp. YT155]
MKKLILVLLSLMLVATGCTSQSNSKTKSNKSEESTKKLSDKDLKELKEDMGQLDISLTYYDNFIGNIGYNVQEGMDAETVTAVKEMATKMLTNTQVETNKNDEKYLEKLNKLPLDTKAKKNYVDNYKKIRQYQNDWIDVLKNFSDQNISETATKLKENQDVYLEVSTDLGYARIELLKAAGLTEKQAKEYAQKSIKKIMQKYGDPEDVEQLD